jgi:hypothetical protein
MMNKIARGKLITSGLNARKEKSRSKIISKENMNIDGAKILLAASI